jgi:hypothetical protein
MEGPPHVVALLTVIVMATGAMMMIGIVMTGAMMIDAMISVAMSRAVMTRVMMIDAVIGAMMIGIVMSRTVMIGATIGTVMIGTAMSRTVMRVAGAMGATVLLPLLLMCAVRYARFMVIPLVTAGGAMVMILMMKWIATSRRCMLLSMALTPTSTLIPAQHTTLLEL